MMFSRPQLLASLFAVGAVVLPTTAHPQEPKQDDPAIQNAPADASEPSLDDLLGLDDEPADDKPADHDHGDDKPADGKDPELTRDLDRALTGQEKEEQFVQAIKEMGEVAVRLEEAQDPGIETQRMQDEIILKLEQLIASAQKTKSQQQQQQGKPKPGQPREADQGGKQQPGQQQGQKPGDKPGQKPGDKPGDKPGEKQGDQPGDKPGGKDGKKPGEQQGKDGKDGKDGQKPGEGDPKDGKGGNGGTQKGSLKNAELTMKDLREGEWGNLPPRLRDELAESLSETFNPVYREATEAFFRRIAELSRQQAEDGE